MDEQQTKQAVKRKPRSKVSDQANVIEGQPKNIAGKATEQDEKTSSNRTRTKKKPAIESSEVSPKQKLDNQLRAISELGSNYEIHDPFAEVTYRPNTSKEAVEIATRMGATRFQHNTAEGVVQIDIKDGVWADKDGKTLANYQQEADERNLSFVKETIALRQAASDKRVEVNLDSKLADAHKKLFKNTESESVQEQVAKAITEYTEGHPVYKSQIEQASMGNNISTVATKIYELGGKAQLATLVDQTTTQTPVINLDVLDAPETQPALPKIELDADTKERLKNVRQADVDAFKSAINSIELVGREKQQQSESAQSRTENNKTQGQGTEQEQTNQSPPDWLQKRYLQAENKYYYRDLDNKVAFEDKGKRLATEHSDPEVARAMVELATSKGWKAIQLNGTDEFKREAWLYASLKGLEVQGYQPREVDLAKLEEIRNANARPEKASSPNLNTIERGRERAVDNERPAQEKAVTSVITDEPKATLSKEEQQSIDALSASMRQRGDSEKAIAMTATQAAEVLNSRRVYVGKVIAHGTAHFDNNPEKALSYYVKLQTPAGNERVVWGVDFERSAEAGALNVGENVAIVNRGSREVTVTVIKDDGQRQNVITSRHIWDVKQFDQLKESERNQLLKSAELANQKPQLKVYDRGAARQNNRENQQNREHETSRELVR